jgi:Ca-activated chloride channel family protein
LKYEAGAYEFVFPMVVGPRYIPGQPNGQKRGNGFAPDTSQVPDASRITPKMIPPSFRSGHDVSLDIQLDAGLLIDALDSKTHPVDIERPDGRSAHIRLKESATIPNKDFVLRYDVAGGSIQDAILTHRSDKGGFFTMILQPPDRVAVQDVTPKELVFVLDTSGSMEGFPIEKAKETMKLAMDSLYPSDTFNLITFAGNTDILFPHPVPATKENIRKAPCNRKGLQKKMRVKKRKNGRGSQDKTEDDELVFIIPSCSETILDKVDKCQGIRDERRQDCKKGKSLYKEDHLL